MMVTLLIWSIYFLFYLLLSSFCDFSTSSSPLGYSVYTLSTIESILYDLWQEYSFEINFTKHSKLTDQNYRSTGVYAGLRTHAHTHTYICKFCKLGVYHCHYAIYGLITTNYLELTRFMNVAYSVGHGRMKNLWFGISCLFCEC